VISSSTGKPPRTRARSNAHFRAGDAGCSFQCHNHCRATDTTCGPLKLFNGVIPARDGFGDFRFQRSPLPWISPDRFRRQLSRAARLGFQSCAPYSRRRGLNGFSPFNSSGVSRFRAEFPQPVIVHKHEYDRPVSTGPEEKVNCQFDLAR